MKKFEHWQDAGKELSHGWVTAEDIPTKDRRTVVVLRAPVGNKIILNMPGAIALHDWLGELLQQVERAEGER